MSSPTPPKQPASTAKEQLPIRYLDPITAYDLWSEVYDTDGNFLQALDAIEMRILLPNMLSQISTPPPWKLVDLGCGTGRNTLQLLNVPGSIVVGLDSSPKMLEIAKSNINARMATSRGASGVAKQASVELHNLLDDSYQPASALYADAVISTLVLEHVPIPTFFQAVSQILKPDGLLLVTNMHSDMGKISQAGFVDPKTQEKVRTESFAHRLEDLIAEAEKQGFEVVGEVLETGIDGEMSEVLGARAKKWIGVMVWFGVCFRRV